MLDNNIYIMMDILERVLSILGAEDILEERAIINRAVKDVVKKYGDDYISPELLRTLKTLYHVDLDNENV